MRRARVSLLTALAALACVAAPVGAGATGGAAPAVSAVEADAYSNHWSGFSRVDGGFTTVRAHLVVPSVSNRCGAGSAAALYVGLGGMGSGRFVQAGYTLTPNVGGIQGAWYEVMNDWTQPPPVVVPFVGRVGDRVGISVAYDRSHDALNVVWKNTTRGTTTRRTILTAHRWMPDRAHSIADWITERPDVPTVGAPMASLSPVTWTSVSAVRDGHGFGLSAHLIRHTAVSVGGRVVAEASAGPGPRSFTSTTHHCT